MDEIENPDIVQPSTQQITTLNPQQRKNFIVEEHTFNASGTILPNIDNSQNGTVHAISYLPGMSKPPSFVDLSIGISSIGINQKQTYIIQRHTLPVHISFILKGLEAAKSCGELSTSINQHLIIEVTNINGALYIEGKNYS